MDDNQLMPGAAIKLFRRHEIIFQTGDGADTAYIVRKGKVEISRKVNNQKMVLSTLKAGAIFGEMALLLDDQCRTATAAALEDSEIVILNRVLFQQYVTECPTIIAKILSALSNRLRETTNRIRPDNAYLAACSTLNLLASQGIAKVPSKALLKSLTRSLFLETDAVREILKHLVILDMIAFSPDGETIHFREKEDFWALATRMMPDTTAHPFEHLV